MQSVELANVTGNHCQDKSFHRIESRSTAYHEDWLKVGEIRNLWAKIYILFDAIPVACRKWLKVGFRKVRRVPIILVPKKNQNLL